MIDSLPIICFFGVAAGAVAWIILHRVVLKKLARDHASSFPSDGRRTIFQKGAMLQLFFVGEFIYKKDYLRIGDRSIIILSRVMKLLVPFAIICFVGMMLSPFVLEAVQR